jgi:hypothetical protein
MTAVGHGAIPLIVGMLWLLIDRRSFAWCVADRGRWRSAVRASRNSRCSRG